MGKSYQVEPRQIRQLVWARGHMTVLEVFKIAAWKSVKGMGSLTENSEHDIVSLTAAAMRQVAPWRGSPVVGMNSNKQWLQWQDTASWAIGSNRSPKSGLMELSGVGYPMATAILAILDPEVWPVIDQWSVQTVF